MTSAPVSSHNSWLSVAALAFAAFIVNTTEFIPIALLSDIGASFGKNSTETGIMITVYAWVVALCSLPLMLLTRRMERRSLLLWLFAIFILGHIVSVLAWRFEVLLISRTAVALTHAVFWSITASLAVRVAPAGKGNQALGWLGTGTVLAMVLGIPLGRIVGNAYGWRLTLLLIAVLAAVTAWVLAKRLPLLPSLNSGSLGSVPVLLKRKSLLILYAFVTLMVTAHFTAYSYIEPFARDVGGLDPVHITALLLSYGVAGFLGSYVFGRWFARHSRLLFVLFSALLPAILFLLLPLAGQIHAFGLLCLVWGMTIMAVSLAAQSRVLHLADDATDVATAMYSSLYNVGIGGGALLGHHAAGWFGLGHIGVVGGVLSLLALALALWLVWQRDFAAARTSSAA
ncbi:DHA1 family L-arabinose/isopropyl-beta-D-thiogalactopyranoside export protein-like MFS transporter [Neisseria sp. HSC-16F19]|nr:sugar transporter [Neisseria sp. HSC-16F19]MCP2041532.1 DHA1 family L-arabinose/isopropyl-beta-D-thiogalactopyranoside export protein-like MFS transporter [Neisseria sp. HSC-16F19]